MDEGRVYNVDFRDLYPMIADRQHTVISDPPYNQRYQYDTYYDMVPDHVYRQLIHDAFSARRAVVMHYPEQMVNIVAPSIGTPVQQIVSWVYPTNTSKQHRLIGWFGFKPNMRAVGQPYKNPEDKRVAKLIADGKQAMLYDWWEVNQVKNGTKWRDGTPHPCPIPLTVAERMVLLSTEPGDLVVDPFAGQGTILEAAKKHGRRYIGAELSSVYTDAANEVLNG